LLAKGEVKRYVFSKNFEEAVTDPFIVLHTSGSTGLPKPVVLTHGWPTASDNHARLPELSGYSAIFPEFRNKRIFSSLPPFHVSFMLMRLHHHFANFSGYRQQV
jgi:acyl-CoA synthetase (AMP-forming)/AMP-acid ligase II